MTTDAKYTQKEAIKKEIPNISTDMIHQHDLKALNDLASSSDPKPKATDIKKTRRNNEAT